MFKLPTLLLSAFSVLILVGAGCEGPSKLNSQPMQPAAQPAAMQKMEPVMEPASGGRMEASNSMTSTSAMIATNILVNTEGSYEAYEASKLSRAETGNVVLFFYAPWCPTCKTVNTDIKNHLKGLPNDLSLLIVDYDSSTELKKKYGVTYQHTFVQVDAQGTLLKKWSGGSTLQSIVAQII
jgi:thiol-disulfide isomerase/thioredoxin